ncbi:hypothetical protein Pan44_42930 [Caulifigura coniformis]|uniref:Glycosyl hydrolase family 32 N-terminal domain-containing protein n=1 Tax=Caulifigura coniformis TaxID=2527983 RepID=A0A517SJD2_9PLAN|nr:hypothetical protein [Caulifigura coniformis]QDT56241.1 hypothetical protein Pan44_42930 [Caulifigura coniformis]
MVRRVAFRGRKMRGFLLGLLLLTSPLVAAPPHRELFVDRHLIESLEGGELTLAEPRDEGPALKFDRPWEGLFSGYATVIRDGELLRLYYRGHADTSADGSPTEAICYAESKDGRNWTKPNLGQFTVHGTRDNNVVLADAAPVTHNFCPFLDRNPAAKPEERFKGVGGVAPGGLIAYVSADGLVWKKLQDKPVFQDKGWVFDSQNVPFWSETENCYVLYYRRAAEKKRAIARTTSTDFVNWSAPVQMRYSDTGTGVPSHQLYTNQTHPYFRAPHIYVSTAARFMHKRQVITPEQAAAINVHPKYFQDTSDAILMTSRGGDLYDRSLMGALIRPGIGARNWVSRTNYPALNIVQTGDTEMSLYVNQDYGQPTAHLHRYSFRLDGLASVRAPLSGATLVTKPITLTGEPLSLNFRTSAAGGIRVEVQDDTGKPLPGFEMEKCVEVIGNEIARPVAWKNADWKTLAGRTVRLRMQLSDADLYAMEF